MDQLNILSQNTSLALIIKLNFDLKNILGFAFHSLTELPVRFLGFNLSLLRHPLELNYDINIFGVIEANSSIPS